MSDDISRRGNIARLGDYIREPTVQNAVLDYITQLDAPFVIGDVWRPLGLPRMNVRHALKRLARKGFLTSRKFPVQVKHPILGTPMTVWQTLYTLVEGM